MPSGKQRAYYEHVTNSGEPMEILTCLSAKGGSAKTTIMVVLAAELTLRGYKVLTIDADTQSSFSKMVGAYSDDEAYSHPQRCYLGDLLLASPARISTLLEGAVIETKFFGSVIAPGPNLKEQERQIASKSGSELRLVRAIEPLNGEYDFMLIDVGRQGTLTANAICAATGTLLAFETSLLGVEAIRQTLSEVEEIRSVYRTGPEIIAVVPTKYLWNRAVHNLALKTLREFPYSEYYSYQNEIKVVEPFECRTAFEKMVALGVPPHHMDDFKNQELYSNCERLVNTILNWKEEKDATSGSLQTA